jgi:hypothetical protein
MELATFLKWAGLAIAVVLVLATITLLWAFRQLRRLRIPEGADLFTTLRAVPLALVVGLDLLDLALDTLSAPLTWMVLGRYRLESLRRVAAIEALLPGTQLLPTLTIAWFAARFFQLGEAYDPTLIETRRRPSGGYEPRFERT